MPVSAAPIAIVALPLVPSLENAVSTSLVMVLALPPLVLPLTVPAHRTAKA